MPLFLAALAGFALGAFLTYVFMAVRAVRLTERANAMEALRGYAEQFQAIAIRDLRQVKTETDESIEKKKMEIEHSVSHMKSRLEECLKTLRDSDKEWGQMGTRIEKSLTQVLDAEQAIRMETSALKRALTTSVGIRGSLGEMILQQILEENGFVKGINYQTQVTLPADGQGEGRPDFIIHLPGGKRLVIDAKEVGGEYHLAQETEDPEKRKAHYEKLVGNIRDNFTRLGRKEYQSLLDPDIPFVVMFISSESAIRAAFQTDTELYRDASSKKVFLASPMTVIPLIQLIKHSWQQHQFAENARDLAEVIAVLWDRLAAFVGHLKNFEEGIFKMNDHWHKALNSWQTRVAPQLDKAKSMGARLKDMPELKKN